MPCIVPIQAVSEVNVDAVHIKLQSLIGFWDMPKDMSKGKMFIYFSLEFSIKIS